MDVKQQLKLCMSINPIYSNDAPDWSGTGCENMMDQYRDDYMEAWDLASLHKQRHVLQFLIDNERYLPEGVHLRSGIEAALHTVAREGDVGTLQWLIDQIDRLGMARGTMLHDMFLLAASRDHCEMVDILLGQGVDINCVSEENGPVQNLLLAQWPFVPKGPLWDSGLLAASNTISHTTAYRISALHLAAERGFLKMTQLLLASGALINLEYSAGCSALHQAVWEDQDEVVRELIAQGCAVDCGSGPAGTPLSIAATLEGNSIAKLLLSNGADPLAVAGTRQKALDYASRQYTLVPQHRHRHHPIFRF